MYKIAVVGIGFIGKKHIQILQNLKEFELAGICDINKEKLQGYNIYKTTNFDDLLKQKFDVVVIATPNYLHAKQTIQALQKGFHVICEKPLAINTQDALQMLEVAQLQNRVLFCMLQNRYSPIVQWLKNIILENKLGKIFWVQVNCFWNRDERYYNNSDWKGKLLKDGGVLFTQFSHFTDILIYLFGHLTNIHYAQFWNFNHQKMIEFEDSGSLNFQLSNKVLVNFNYTISTFKQNLESSITIFGEKGTIKIGGQYMNEILFCNIIDHEIPRLPPTPPANQYAGYQGSASNHQYVYEEFIQVLKGHKPTVLSLLDAFYSVNMIEEIYKRRT